MNSTLSPERREDFLRRLSERYAEQTGMSVDECREIAEAVNRGGPHPHRDRLIGAAFAVMADRIREITTRRREPAPAETRLRPAAVEPEAPSSG